MAAQHFSQTKEQRKLNALLLLMGGSGERFGGDTPKQFLDIDYQSRPMPLFEITARKLLAALPIDVVIFVSPKNTVGSAIVNPVIERLMTDFPGRKMKYAAAGLTRDTCGPAPPPARGPAPPADAGHASLPRRRVRGRD